MKRGPFVTLVLLFIISGSFTFLNFPNTNMNLGSSDNSLNETSAVQPFQTNSYSDMHELQGKLDPVIVEQRGYRSSGLQAARTDINPSVTNDLPLDDTHGWVGSQAQVDITDLKRLYVANGTFENGLPGLDQLVPDTAIHHYPYGWNATAYNPDNGQTQYSAYDDSGSKFVVVENQGKKIGPSGNQYDHVAGSEIVWYQILENSPYTENFYLSFDYYYLRGPLGNGVIGEGRIFAMVDGTVIWNTSIPDLPQRQTWYSVENFPVTISGASSILNFSIGIIVDQTFDLNSDQDNDGDGYADGLANTFYLTTWFDDISFVGQSAPYFESVDMQFTAGANTTSIAGSLGSGTAIIANPANWISSPVFTGISSNASVSFNYEVKLLSHKYSASNSGTSASEIGVNYYTNPDSSPELSFYTYVGSLGSYQNLNISIEHPSDWENATIYDPQSDDVTSQCTLSQGSILIPTSLLIDQLGWWFVSIRSSNYIDSLVPEIYDSGEDLWNTEYVFRSTNVSRIAVNIGSGTSIPKPLNLVNVSWIMPDSTIWFTESVSGGTMGSIDSSEVVFGSLNTTAGQWQALVSWTNGTELAFGSVSFEVHHRATLYPDEGVIDIEGLLSVSTYVYYKDNESGAFLMDSTASITANWSSTIVTFTPVPLENRWIGTFDTALVGPGAYTVVVNASRSFFDKATCTFVISVSSTDNELSIDNPTAVIGIGDTFLATFSYRDANGIGIPNANVSVDLSGPPEGITWSDANDLGGGEYSIEFKAAHSGDYKIKISALKEYYQKSDDTLFISVGDKTTSLSLENGTSAVISFGEQYRLVVQYANGTGFGLENASVTVQGTAPGTGIIYTPTTDEGNGYYSILLIPTNTGTYTILINASITDHKEQLKSFTLTATPIATQLRIAGGINSASVGVFQPFQLLVLYEEIDSTPVNISGSTLQIIFTSFESVNCTITPLSEGYLIQIPTDTMGSYEFTITASKPGYQNDAVDFILFIRERAMRIEMNTPIWERTKDLNITLRLLEVDTDNPISGANVTYRLSRFLGVVMEGYLTEVTPGIYSVSLRPSWGDGTGYSIRFFADVENFALDNNYVFDIIQTTLPGVVLQILIQTYVPPIIAVFVVSIVSLSSRVVYKRKKKAEFAVDLANKRRFDDADNIIGIIVMHKLSGIPIYSRIVKGGFEEGIIAAFIAAVTHFREEFEILEEQRMQVIPISDIIRAVQTQNLICAFITVKSASIEHNRRMEAFGMQIGTYLDDFYAEKTPQSAQDLRIAEIVDYVYYETMDGNLLKFHKVAESASFPKRYRSIELVFQDRESAHCTKPVYLAKALSKYGVSEGRGCTLVSEVLEKRLLVPCEEHEIPPMDVDLTPFLEKDDSENIE
ncbi:MAG: carboxypeptidase regulatory-like domain-containing protein [Candidatus Thorarchaeota archaeon]|nr:carboxypeptidase regulatory-like domain-containing protein [Candidatus Thorarchaeota archaeon]